MFICWAKYKLLVLEADDLKLRKNLEEKKRKNQMGLYNLPITIWFLLLLIPVMFFLKKMVIQLKTQTNIQLPPSPPKLPILGNFHQLGSSPHQSLTHLSKIYGPVMFLKLGRVPVVVISSAEAAREVLKIHDLDCCSRPQLTGNGRLSYNYKDISFAPYGATWREIRKICVLELLSVKRVQSFRLIRERETALLIDSISQSQSSTFGVDLTEKMYALTGSIVFQIVFGKRFRGSSFDNHRFEELIIEAMTLLASFTADEYLPYNVGWIIDRVSGYHAKLERVFHELDTFFQQIIDDHLQPQRTKQDQEDIINVLLKVERDGTESAGEAKLSHDHIKAVLMDIFLAGVDTSAITVIWAMAELARNHRIMEKAQNEVRNCIGKKGRVTEEDIDQLQYLKMIVKETLRLHPPVPLLLPRETISHFKIDDYDIYPKTQIQINVWAIGKDLNYWKEPEEFYPERFVDNSVDYKGQHFEFLPFGGGRRGCPGIYMGITTTELALANLLYCFDWKLPYGLKGEDINMEEGTGVRLTISKETPLCLVPVNYLQ